MPSPAEKFQQCYDNFKHSFKELEEHLFQEYLAESRANGKLAEIKCNRIGNPSTPKQVLRREFILLGKGEKCQPYALCAKIFADIRAEFELKTDENSSQTIEGLNRKKISKVFDSLKPDIEQLLQSERANRTCGDKVLNFLKSCVNLLITIITFGHQQNFFKSSTFYAEQIKSTQQELHDLVEHDAVRLD